MIYTVKSGCCTVYNVRKFALEICTKQHTVRGLLGTSKNVICGLMVTRYSTDISSQTLWDNKKLQEIDVKSFSFKRYVLSDLKTTHSVLFERQRSVAEVGGLSVLPCMGMMTDCKEWVFVHRELAWKQNITGKTVPFKLYYTFFHCSWAGCKTQKSLSRGFSH